MEPQVVVHDGAQVVVHEGAHEHPQVEPQEWQALTVEQDLQPQLGAHPQPQLHDGAQVVAHVT